MENRQVEDRLLVFLGTSLFSKRADIHAIRFLEFVIQKSIQTIMHQRAIVNYIIKSQLGKIFTYPKIYYI